MYKTFTLPLRSAFFALSSLFILAACGGFTIDLNSLLQDSECSADPFNTQCDGQSNISVIRSLIIEDCANNPEKADTPLCREATASTNPSSGNEGGAVGAVVDNTPKKTEVKIEFDKNSLTKTDKEKAENTSLEIVDLCSDPANAKNARCSPEVIDCINNPFSGSCEGDNVLGNFVRGDVTVSKAVILQTKRAVDCRDGNIDRAQCQTLNSEKARCAGTDVYDANCSAVVYSVCKANVFDPLCGDKLDVESVYFNERSDTCYEEPNNPNCIGTNGHIAVACDEYPFDRLCTGNTDYDVARANACESDPTVSSDCPVVDVCLDNPFGPTCVDSVYNNARRDLVKTCAIQAVTGAVTSACNTIIAAAGPCFIDPFDTSCDSNPAVRSYIAQLRSSRVAFCKNSTGLFDHLVAPLCTGAPVAKSVCRIDPFNTVCIGDNDYDNSRLSACRDGTASSGQCGNIIAGVCRNDPFDTLCGSGYNNARESACRDGSASSGQCGNIVAGVCRDNPFDPLCGSGYNDVRLSACRDGSASSGQCGNIIRGVCRDNPFDSLCGGGYNNARENACRNGSPNTQCGNIITGVCGNNPFDSLCGSNYDGNRERACASNPNSSRCRDTLTRVCGGNPFSRLCRNTQSYLNARVNICRGNPLDGRCGGTISGICNDDPFDTVCGNPGWNNARETACRNGSASSWQCRDTVAGICSGNPFDSLCGSGYTQSRRSLCTDNPFAPRCAGDVYNDLRVSFCEGKVGTHSSCPAPEPTTPQVTAGVWADSFDEDLAHGVTANDRKSQFLIARETDLDTGGRSVLYNHSPNYSGNLNLADATFNGVALGGDRADGAAFFAAERANNRSYYSYAGILQGTNLGAPLTDTQGSAKWIGSFRVEGYSPTDFVLNVSFGTGAGAGEIEALVQNYGDSNYIHDFHVKGEFDDTGVITGTARRGVYRTNDPDNRGRTSRSGKLTGLIGEEGAVGAFLIGNSFGGFVARPTSANELRTLEQTCADDPFNKGCTIGYESERNARLDHCIIGGNANDAICESAKELNNCIDNPFKSDCYAHLSQHYQQARINRVAFCRTAGNANNGLCTVERTFRHICINYPFDAQCLGNGDYNQAREDACTTAGTGSTECRTLAGLNCSNDPFHSYCDSGYNDARASACISNPGQQRCVDTVERVCNGNPFDTLCRNTTVYLNARKTQCRSTWNDPRCGATIRAVCGVDPFDRMCNSVYDTPRETACRAGSTNTQCGGIIASVCSGNPFDSLCGSGYTQSRRSLCTDNPFAPRCAGDVYNDLRVSFCEGKVGTHVSCPAPQVTAKVWADSFDEDLAHGVTADDTESQFLIARETDLDNGGRGTLYRNSSDYSGNLNLADARFNGVALGGDAADGMAFFAAEIANNGGHYSYVGILSGTNLGAPLTDTTGSAKWIGSFRLERGSPTDFVLNISFGTGAGAGEIEALVQRYIDFDDYHLKGEFDDAGVITGKVGRGNFRDRTDDPNNRGITGYSSKLTGLIGEEGAVGAFLYGNSFGGFVARPSSTDELQTLAQTCADDPFHNNCSVGYESERSARIEHCIIGDNSRNAALCGGLKRFNYCISNPFHTECESLLSQHYEQARANRVAFCRTAGNADNGLCTVAGAFAHICTNHPFDAQCLGNDDYNQARQDACTNAGTGSTECRLLAGINCSANPFHSYCDSRYNDARASACNANPGQSRCRNTVERVCNGNPFDTLCRNTTVYLNARKTQCRSTWNDLRCLATIRSVCGVDPFDRMCNSLYDTPRETACRAGSTNTQCGGIIASVCSGNPFDSLCGSGYTQSRRSLCTDNPFALRCAGEGYNDLRVSFCEENAGTHPSCPAPEPTTPQVTAEVWADSFDEELASAASSSDTDDKFIKARATDLDKGDVRVMVDAGRVFEGSLNLADATFNGVALGGDAADGISYFYGYENGGTRVGNSYGGILSGTNLGAPLTQTQGSVKWIGSWREYTPSERNIQDFVLHITFGGTDKAGSIEAIIDNKNWGRFNRRIVGDFDDAGVITGNLYRGWFVSKNLNDRWHNYRVLPLTGLIGEEGAVGVTTGYIGGFVARPASQEELATVAQICTDNPFDKRCAGEEYHAQRDVIIEQCIIGDNASNDALCGDAVELHDCIADPFGSICSTRLRGYTDRAQANRMAFCRTEGNADHALCTSFSTARHICRIYPFDGQCLNSDQYTSLRRTACASDPFAMRCAAARYNDLRVSFCAENAGNPDCLDPIVPDTTPNRVTTADWLENFEYEVPSTPTNGNTRSFFEARENDLNSGTLGLNSRYPYTRHGVKMLNLNFDTASYDGKYLNGDAADGVAFFQGEAFGRNGSFRYVGILSGTDLGAPMNRTGRATWNGSINSTGSYSYNQDFSLDIEFNGATGGTIFGFTKSLTGLSEGYLKLTGAFDAHGVITGTTDQGLYTNDNPDLPIAGRRTPGTLTGLIGEEGAVGAFVAASRYTAYVGGFVVRPSAKFDSPEPLVNNARVTTADWLNSFNEDLPIKRRVPTNGRIGYPYTGENHFVRAAKTGLALNNYTRATHRVVTFDNVTFDGKAVGGDAADGFALSFNSYAQHVGILSGTDLGSPFTQRQGSVSWNARMVALANKSEAVVGDFILHINFGTGGQAGTITGQAIAKPYGVRDHRSADYKYKVDGTFDDSGVIRGTSQFGNFNYEDTKIPRYWRNSGTLTGLIGEEGAIGVFISDTGGYSGYVGGFIAIPSLQNYVSSGDLSDYYHLPWPTDPLYRNETSSFLAASSTGEMNTGTLLTRDGNTPTVETLTLANATYQGRALGGDATDGVAFFKGWKGPTDTTRSTKIHYRVYSGIFDDINLGAPVTQTSGKAYWKGQFKSVHFDRVVSKDFTLKVTFYEGLGTRTAGRVDALVHDTGLKHFAVSAVFNNRGVIDGNILFGDYENDDRTEPYSSYTRADLVGLIGQEGAIAIFKNPAPSQGSRSRPRELEFAGGFVAVPNLPPVVDTTPNQVTTADWLASFGTAPATVADVNRNHFLQIPNALPSAIENAAFGTTNSKSFTNISLYSLKLDDDIFQDGGGDAADGMVFYQAHNGDDSDSYFYAGILHGTDLGAPLTQTSGTATWSGRFHAVLSGSILRAFSRDFTLDITFNTTGGDISTIVSGRTEDYFELDGTFNNRGVISGTANHVYYENGRIGDVTGDIVNSGPVTGLIGQQGAVGAFISNRQTGPSAGSGFAGGFVARPPSE